MPTLVSGDREFSGHGPNVVLQAELNVVDADSVTCRLYMFAEETASNWSTAEGENTWTLYRAPKGWEIADLYPEGWSCDINYVDDNNSVDYHGCAGFAFQSIGDISGDDIETPGGTQVTVQVSDFSVELHRK